MPRRVGADPRRRLRHVYELSRNVRLQLPAGRLRCTQQTTSQERSLYGSESQPTVGPKPLSPLCASESSRIRLAANRQCHARRRPHVARTIRMPVCEFLLQIRCSVVRFVLIQADSGKKWPGAWLFFHCAVLSLRPKFERRRCAPELRRRSPTSLGHPENLPQLEQKRENALEEG